MNEPKFLYHGSARAIEGAELLPMQASSLDDDPEQLLRAVYATDAKEIAIAMAIISCAGVKGSSLSLGASSKAPFGIIYEGWPKQDYIYLCTLPSNSFKNTGGRQWVSLKPVKPIKIEKLAVSDYLHLVRKATKREVKKWFEKYKDKIGKCP